MYQQVVCKWPARPLLLLCHPVIAAPVVYCVHSCPLQSTSICTVYVGKLTQFGNWPRVTRLLCGRRRTHTQVCQTPMCVHSGAFSHMHLYILATFLVLPFMLFRLGQGFRRRELLPLQPHLLVFYISYILYVGILSHLPPCYDSFILAPGL